MKKLITTDATATRAIPIQSKTVKFIQDSNSELHNLIAESLVGVNYDNTKHYVITGCVNTGSGSNYIISAGLVYSGGVLYLVPSATFTLGGGEYAVLSLTTTYLSGVDPVTFIGTTNSYNIHEDKKLVVASAVSGSGVVDYNDLIFVTAKQTLTLTANYSAGSPVSVRRNRDGMISLVGGANGGASAATTQTITTLPVGYRPLTALSIIHRTNTAQDLVITIDTAGNMVCSGILGGATSLNGVGIIFDSFPPFYTK